MNNQSVHWDSGSFRDPEGFVFFKDDKVFRTLSDSAEVRMKTLLESGFFKKYMQDGRVIPTKLLKNPFAKDGVRGNFILEHERISCITYPYEWSFSMLQEATTSTLSLLKECLENGFILKDGTAWNFTCVKGKMCFFDILSIGAYEEGQPWEGYEQFCQEFLLPLLLKAHKNIDFQSFFKGSLKGVNLQLANAVFGVLDWRLPGVFKHVFLNAKFSQNKAIAKETVKNKLKIPKTSLLHMVEGMLKVVQGLRDTTKQSTWIDYTQNNTYEEADTRIKEKFISEFVGSTKDQDVILDLGCNTGHFSRIAAKNRSVLSCDIDSNCIDDLYEYLGKNGVTNITPVVLDLMNPSSECGWRLKERRSFYNRLKGEGFLALALIHHLCIAQNVPLESFVVSLSTMAPCGVIEWVSKEDPMVQFLLRNREDIFPNYTWACFEKEISKHFKIKKTKKLNDATRTLCWLEPK